MQAITYVRTSILLSVSTYMGVATTVLEYLMCQPLPHDEGGPWRVLADPSIECDSSEYQRLLPWVRVVLVVHVVGLPVGLLVALRWASSSKTREASAGDNVWRRGTLDVLASNYNEHNQYWEVFHVVRRVALLVVCTMPFGESIEAPYEQQFPLQVGMLFFLNGSFAVIHQLRQPFENKLANSVEWWSLFVLTVLCVLGLHATLLFDETQDQGLSTGSIVVNVGVVVGSSSVIASFLYLYLMLRREQRTRPSA